MPHEQYAASLRKLQCVFHAREDTVLRGEPDCFCPVRFRQNRQGTDILSEAGPAQKRTVGKAPQAAAGGLSESRCRRWAAVLQHALAIGEVGARPRIAVPDRWLRQEVFLTIMREVRKAENVMSTDATLTSKGQTTIPKQIRDSLGMKAGDRMTFTLMPGGLVLMRVKNKSVMSLAGSLHKKGPKRAPVEQLSR